LQHFGSERFLTAVQGVDVLFANADEARLLSGTDDLEAAIASLASSASEVVVTNGSQGASVWRDGVIEHVASIAVDVVDTTGAGDATAGTYLAWRLDGHDVGAALRAAMVAAARVVATIGSGDGSR
jgi:sugar/nucleoside kinase (ribokinase family)